MAVAAYPYVEVRIVPPPPPVVQRSPGVIAVVGASGEGSAPVNTPEAVAGSADVAAKFGAGTALGRSLLLALKQEPPPARVYGVKVAGDAYAAALSGLEAADDVTMVSLAGEVDPAKLADLKTHVETLSGDGQRMLGFAMVDPARAKSATYVADVVAAMQPVKSAANRMVVVAARGADGDVATAAMGAVAGLPVHHSLVLKKILGVAIPVVQQYSPLEIRELSQAKILPIIDPALISGESLHFADGWLFGNDDRHVDLIRTLDDLEFRLRAGLIGLIGDARITKAGMTLLKTQVDGILGVQKRLAVIDDYRIEIPVLDVLAIPEAARTPADTQIVTDARSNRQVDLVITVFYGPAVSRLLVTLVAKF